MKVDMACVWQHKWEQIDIEQDIALKSEVLAQGLGHV